MLVLFVLVCGVLFVVLDCWFRKCTKQRGVWCFLFAFSLLAKLARKVHNGFFVLLALCIELRLSCLCCYLFVLFVLFLFFDFCGNRIVLNS